MENNNFIIQSELKRLKALHTSMLIGCIVFLMVAFYVNRSTGGLFINDKSLCQTLGYISILLLGLLPLSYYIFKRKIEKIMPEQDINEKVVIYRSAYFIKIAMIESACFLSIAVYICVNTRFVLYQLLMILVVFLMSYPYKGQMIAEMKEKE